MKLMKHITLAALLLAAGAGYAQKWSEGKDLSYLKGQSPIMLQYTFDNMTVGKKQPEAEYVKEKTDEYNKKEAGKGDSWAMAWIKNRERVFYPKFEQLFNEESSVVKGNRDQPGAKYTIIIHTTRTEPGFNIGVTKKPAACDFEIMIVETANPAHVLSKGILKNVPGSQFGGMDFDSSARIAECYAKAGKTIGKTVNKATK